MDTEAKGILEKEDSRLTKEYIDTLFNSAKTMVKLVNQPEVAQNLKEEDCLFNQWFITTGWSFDLLKTMLELAPERSAWGDLAPNSSVWGSLTLLRNKA